ncbi:hypothetical protein Tco_0755305 [Tanacetum coccineum]
MQATFFPIHSSGDAKRWVITFPEPLILGISLRKLSSKGTMNRQLLDSQRPSPDMTPAQALTVIQTVADHS